MKNLFTTGYPTEINGWFITDDDYLQYCKKDVYDKKEGIYQFVQYIQYDEDYTIVTDTIDIYDYIYIDDEQAYEFVINVLESYGFGLGYTESLNDTEKAMIMLTNFQEVNGKEWKRILAECMFEYMIFSADEIDKGLNIGQMYLTLSNFLQTN